MYFSVCISAESLPNIFQQPQSPTAIQSWPQGRSIDRLPDGVRAVILSRLQIGPRLRRYRTNSAPIQKLILATVSCASPPCRRSRWIVSVATNICSGGKPVSSCSHWSRCGAASRSRDAQAFRSRFGDTNETPCPTSSGNYQAKRLSHTLGIADKFSGIGPMRQ